MKCRLMLTALILPAMLKAQHVGIGTANPTGPLSFPNVQGNKIVLWGDGNITHYGLGIQNGSLQMYTDIGASSISFGHGRSASFTERMRVINGGGDGLELNGRIILKNGTAPLDPAYGSGVWLYKADNSALLGFMGTQNNQNIGFYGGPAGWGFTYDAINSRVGIGNNNPNAPLAFPAALGKKITLYPGATGDVGLGVAGNRLQIYSDNPNADVAIGYDAAGVFNERFSIKPNGALAILGNTGAAGQVITSGGSGSASWGSGMAYLYQNSVKKISTSQITLTYPSSNQAVVPDLTHTFTVNVPVKALVMWNYSALALSCAFCGTSTLFTDVRINGGFVHRLSEYISNGNYIIASGSTLIDVAPGTHTIDIYAYITGPDVRVGGNGTGILSNMVIILIPSQ